jgi:hypothetical protein
MRLRIRPTADRVDCVAADQEGQKLAAGALSGSAVEDQPECGGDVKQSEARVRSRGHDDRAWLVDGSTGQPSRPPILEVSCWYCQSGVWSNTGAGLTRREATAIRG